jgi:hypothetical protein
MESFDALSFAFPLNMPLEEPQLQKETWPRAVASHSDESSREGLPALPGLGNLAPSDSLLEIDQRFVTYDPQGYPLADQN